MRTRTLLFVASLFMTGSAAASEAPKVEYAADSFLETSEGVMQGSVNVTPGKERREYVHEGEKNIMIMRHDKKVIWMLMPADKMYMEMKYPKEGRKDDLSGYKIETSMVGPDTVNGVKATKSKIMMTGPKGDKLGGFGWRTKEGIFVKLDAIAVDKNSKERFKTELTNLKVGKQDPSLFEIPSGWTKMDMGNMMSGGMSNDNSDKPAPQSGKSKSSFGLKDAIDLLK